MPPPIPSPSAVRRSAGAMLRAAREGQRLTQRALAERMGTTEPQVSNIETGGPATVLSLVRYAAALGLAVELRLVRPRNNKKGSRK